MTKKLDLVELRDAYFSALSDRIQIEHTDINLKSSVLGINTGMLDTLGDEIELFLSIDEEGYVFTDAGWIISNLESYYDFNPETFNFDILKPSDYIKLNYDKDKEELQLHFNLLEDAPEMEDIFKQIIAGLQAIVVNGTSNGDKD